MPNAGPSIVVATVTVVFGVPTTTAAGEVAGALLEHAEVVTVRIGRPGERSVYRVDVPADVTDWQPAAVRPAETVAHAAGVDLQVLSVVTGDPYGVLNGETPAGGLPPRE